MTAISWKFVLPIVLVVFAGCLWAANRYLKTFFWRITFCLTPVVLAGLVVTLAARRYEQGQGGFKLGVDLVGGTILVYEIDQDRFTDPRQKENYKPELLVNALKKRIDPADLYNVTIRPVGQTRVELILPTGGKHQAEITQETWEQLLKDVQEKWPDKDGSYPDTPKLNELEASIIKQYANEDVKTVQAYIDAHYNAGTERRHLTTEEVREVKEKISHIGSLEFRILANNRDDKDAIKVAQDTIEKTPKDVLRSRAILGQPPPPPQPPDTQGFPITLHGETDKYSYSWVELGKEERNTLGLDNAAENDSSVNKRSGGAPRNTLWKTLAKAREDNRALLVHDGRMLIYSRKFEYPRPAPRDRNKKYEYFVLTRDPLPGKAITGDYLTSARQTTDKIGRIAIGFGFNQTGGNLFRELTTLNQPDNPKEETGFKRSLAILLDGQIFSAPTVNSVIGSEGIIEGQFTKADVDRTINGLRSGALPATLKPEPAAENTIGPTLGDDTIRAGTYSVGLAFITILVFMLIYYRFAGMVACIALLANLLLTVGFMVLVKATFTLPGLAGLVLMLGMAVDANVLIYERLREERDRGASLALAIRNGYDRAFPTIIDTHLSSIFTAIVLYVVGNDQLKGFGISLTMGLIISLFTSLYMTRLLFDVWLAKNWLHKLSMFRLLSRPNFDFMGIRYYWFTATILLTIIGATVFIYRLDKGGLNIDFVGGTAYTGRLNQMVTMAELRADLAPAEKDLPDLSVEQIFSDNPDVSEKDKSTLFNVRTTEKNPNKVQETVNKYLQGKLKIIQLTKFDIEPAHNKAALEFSEPASPAQVTGLLSKEFKNQDLENVAQRFTLIPEGRGEGGLYQKMRLELTEAIDATKFQTVLRDTKDQFSRFPQPERLENFDSALAEETRYRALYAIVASWAAILLYLWFRFGSWTFGLAAVLCLIHDLFFTLGIIAFCHYIHESAPGLASFLLLQDFKIDLPAVAALLTLVGYSVNDTIVVFDRIREVRGKNPELTPQMINDSVNQTLSRTLLTSFATWLVVIVLYIWGGEGVHLFAFCMVVGVIVGTYSSIYIASPLLLIFGEGTQPSPARARVPQPAGATV